MPNQLDKDDEAHEYARRLARMLVAEIKMDNEEKVQLGRRNNDLYVRLQTEIDNGRRFYEERVEPRIAKSTDYYYQELIRILADGNPTALGI